jgi:hypothetical protein
MLNESAKSTERCAIHLLIRGLAAACAAHFGLSFLRPLDHCVPSLRFFWIVHARMRERVPVKLAVQCEWGNRPCVANAAPATPAIFALTWSVCYCGAPCWYTTAERTQL